MLGFKSCCGLCRGDCRLAVGHARVCELCMCVWVCAANQRQTPFVSMKTFALDAAMTAAAQLTREGGGGSEGGGSEGGEKERVEYLAYLTCRPRCCSVQQLRNEVAPLVKTENVSLGREVSKREKDRKQACFGSDRPGSARLL